MLSTLFLYTLFLYALFLYALFLYALFLYPLFLYTLFCACGKNSKLFSYQHSRPAQRVPWDDRRPASWLCQHPGINLTYHLCVLTSQSKDRILDFVIVSWRASSLLIQFRIPITDQDPHKEKREKSWTDKNSPS